MKEINYHYTTTKNGFEIDLIEMPFKQKVIFAISLLMKKKIEIYGKNVKRDAILGNQDVNCVTEVEEEEP